MDKNYIILKTRLIVLLLGILISNQALVVAQDCPSTDITIESQEDITSFINAYPNCTILTNSLIINQDTSKTAIISLEEFENITRINGDLIIQNCQSLRFLDGLFQLGYIGLQSVVITDNPMLQQCDINAICDAFIDGVNLEMIVSNNEAGCASAEEIISTCVDTSCPDRLPGFQLIDQFNSEFEGHTYFISEGGLSWLDAQSQTLGLSTAPGMIHLASIQSEEENEFIRSRSEGDFYIGLNDIAQEGTLVWDDNSEVAFENFQNPFQNNTENDFGVMDEGTGQWYLNDGDTIMQTVVELACEALSPDLALSRLESSEEITGTEQVLPYSIAIHNIGSKTASGSVLIKTYLSTDKDFDENVDLLAGEIFTGNLNPRFASRVESTVATITIPSNIGGLFYLISVIDTENNIEEKNESNNLVVSYEPVMVFDLTNKCLGGGQVLWKQEQVDTLLNSFEECTVINGDITFQGFDLDGNPSDDPITNLQTLEQITFIEGALNLESLPLLNNLKGLNNLQKIAAGLRLIDTNIPDLKDLSNVQILGGLNIKENPELTSLDGLNNIKTIYASQDISNNPSLISLYELDSDVNLSGIILIEIYDNENLSDCNNQTMCAMITTLDPPFEYRFQNNGPSCTTNMEVEDQCGLEFPLGFEIYLDLNENGVRNNNEPNYADGYIEVLERDEKHFIGNVNEMGEIGLPRGNYTIVFDEERFLDWSVTTNNTIINQEITGPGAEPISIGLAPINSTATEREDDVITYIESQKTIFGETTQLQIHSKNIGNRVSAGQIILTLDQRVNIVSFMNSNPISLGGGMFAFEYDNLLPGQATSRSILIAIPSEQNIGEGAALEFTGYAISESGVQKSAFTYETPVKSSFEPNDKSLHPNRDGNINLIEDFLTYTIRFQNDFGDTISNLIIKDTLDINLDVDKEFFFLGSQASVEPIVEIQGDRFLTFTFDNINLVDIATNFSQSQGSLSFLIKAKQDVEDNTIIENTAHLCFDREAPLATNTVVSHFFEELPPCQIGTTLSFTQQSQIDDFLVANGDCASISGTLFIDGEDITNLNGLSNIDQLFGDLIILNTSLIDLEGLNNLSSVEGNIEIEGNNSLVNFNGLDLLGILKGNLIIQNNNSLKNFVGARSIIKIEGSLIIMDNDKLGSFEGFNNISRIDEDLIIENNNFLTDLSGLNGVTADEGLNIIGGSLEISNNESLDAFRGLNNLERINQDFIIRDNPSLKTLIGLAELTNIEGDFQIENNSNLSTLNGINKINTIGEDFKVDNNNLLPNFRGMQTLEDITGQFVVSSNNSLTNFDGLQALERISEKFVVSDNNSLSSFEGLESLTSVMNNFELLRNEALTSLDGLQELKNIRGSFIIRGNMELKSLEGLDLLNEIEGELSLLSCGLTTLNGLNEVQILRDLFVSFSNDLSNFSGLEGLRQINSFIIDGNEKLLSLSGLGLTSVTGDLVVMATNIRTLGGLDSLNRVQGNLVLSGNDDLETIASLESLNTLNGDLTIVGTSISNISALHNIEKFNGAVTIQYNANLSTCEIAALCDFIEENNEATIGMNGENCSSPEEVRDQCNLLIDNDNDGFPAAEDCDDEDPTVYPGAEEVSNNGIDEDCDGEDLIVSTHQLGDLIIDVYPNPTMHFIFIETNIGTSLNYELMDISGKTWKRGTTSNSLEKIEVTNLDRGLYLLKIFDSNNGKYIVDRFSKI